MKAGKSKKCKREKLVQRQKHRNSSCKKCAEQRENQLQRGLKRGVAQMALAKANKFAIKVELFFPRTQSSASCAWISLCARKLKIKIVAKIN